MEEIKLWVKLYTHDLYNRAFYKTADATVAEDLVQDTFLAAVKGIRSFQEKSAPKTWLMSILNNKIVDFYRNKSKGPFISDDAGSMEALSETHNFFQENGYWRKVNQPMAWTMDEEEDLLDNEAFRSTLLSCLDELPALWAATLRLKYLEGNTSEAVCEMLQISKENFWQINHRAKLKIRHCLQEKWFRN